MLCLLRRRGESLQIGPDIFVTVLSVKGGMVRLGIDAPQAVGIVRTELSQLALPLEDHPVTGAPQRPTGRSLL